MTDNKHKARALNKGAISARYNGKCPYPKCSANGIIEAGRDMIANGPLGWGHTDCVNAKIHFAIYGEGISLCHTTQNQRMVHGEENWDQVTCKKCLKLRDSIVDIEDELIIAEVLRSKQGLITSVILDSYIVENTEGMKKALSTLNERQLIKYTDVEAEIDAFVVKVQTMSDEELEVVRKDLKSNQENNRLKRAMRVTFYVVADNEHKVRSPSFKAWKAAQRGE